MSRIIVHLDADAFFASVEQAADPRLRGKPIAVGGEKRGIIASASYEARQFGVYTPMPTARARKLCPKLIVLPGDFERYEQFSNWMFGYCYDFTPDVEQTSIDEGYFDLSASDANRRSKSRATVRQAIRQSLKISVSEGIASNKLVSQIASKLNKPAAFHECRPAGNPFLHPLPNRWLPGIGPKTAARLNPAGLAEIRHIAGTPLELLELLLGGQARPSRQFAHGIDERPLVPAREPQKSFSQQETFAGRSHRRGICGSRPAAHGRPPLRQSARGRPQHPHAHRKVRYNDMAEDQCSESLLEPTDLETDVYGRLRAMLRTAWKRRVSLRMVSLKLSNIYDGRFSVELPLEAAAQRHDAGARLAAALDELRRAHGNGAVLRGPRLAVAMAAPGSRGGVANRPAARSLPNRGQRSPAARAGLRSSCASTATIRFSIPPSRRRRLSRWPAGFDCPAVALTDTGNLHGAAEFCAAAHAAGVKPILGAELRHEGRALLLYVESQRGYHNLCRLLSNHAARPDNEEGSVAAQQRRSFLRREFDGLTEGLIAVSSRFTAGRVVSRAGSIWPPRASRRGTISPRWRARQSITRPPPTAAVTTSCKAFAR